MLPLLCASVAYALSIAPPHTNGYVRLTLPQLVDPGPDGGYPTLRIYDGSNAEVPYALDPARQDEPSRAVAVSDVGFVPGKYTQAILDLGSAGTAHDAVTIETTEQTFFDPVQVAISDDRKTWEIVAADTRIYRVAQTGDDGNQTIATGTTHARWVRVRILDAVAPFPIAGARTSQTYAPPRLVSLDHAERVSVHDRDTVVSLDFTTPNTEIDALAFDASTPNFSRSVEIDVPSTASDDNGISRTTWAPVASGTISRFTLGAPSLVIPVSVRAAHLRVTIHNGNDAALAALNVTPLGTQHVLVFQARPRESYRLTWGGDAKAPQYDLAAQLAHAAWHVAGIAALAEPAAPAPAAPASGSNVSKYVIPIALAAAFAVLAVVVLLTLRTPAEAPHR